MSQPSNSGCSPEACTNHTIGTVGRARSPSTNNSNPLETTMELMLKRWFVRFFRVSDKQPLVQIASGVSVKEAIAQVRYFYREGYDNFTAEPIDGEPSVKPTDKLPARKQRWVGSV